MKAVVVRDYVPFAEVTLGELPDPVPGPGELVLTVEASDANFPDILQIEGRYQVKAPLPFSPGMGAVGRVAALGPDVTGIGIGQRFLALVDHGAHAEMLKAKADWCFPVPDDMPSDIAAALGLAYQTAWFALSDLALLRPGESVLVLGASGGIGMAAIQLAKAMDAGQVIAASRGPEGAALALETGADAVVDSATDDPRSFRDAVLGTTGGKGADVVIDPVGGPLSEAALRALNWSGRLVVVGFASGAVPSFKGSYLLVRNIGVSGIQWTDYRARQLDRVHAAQEQIFALWRDGRLRPRISRRLPLSGIATALADLNAGRARGKIVLTR